MIAHYCAFLCLVFFYLVPQLRDIICLDEVPHGTTDASMATGSVDGRHSEVAIEKEVAVVVLTMRGSAVVLLVLGPVLLIILRVVMPHVVYLCSSHTIIRLLQLLDI